MNIDKSMSKIIDLIYPEKLEFESILLLWRIKIWGTASVEYVNSVQKLLNVLRGGVWNTGECVNIVWSVECACVKSDVLKVTIVLIGLILLSIEIS